MEDLLLFLVDNNAQKSGEARLAPPHVGCREAVSLNFWLNYGVIECVKLFGKALRAQYPKHDSKETNCVQPARA